MQPARTFLPRDAAAASARSSRSNASDFSSSACAARDNASGALSQQLHCAQIHVINRREVTGAWSPPNAGRGRAGS